MAQINIYWLFLIIPVSFIAGFLIAFWIALKNARKIAEKITKDFVKKIRATKSKEASMNMDKGDISSVMAEISKDPEMKKQLEELRKKFGGGK